MKTAHRMGENIANHVFDWELVPIINKEIFSLNNNKRNNPIFFNVYIFLRQRERETQNPKQAPGSELSAQNPLQGLSSQAVRS